jgi:4-azaleucine resistance transporter AzlC
MIVKTAHNSKCSSDGAEDLIRTLPPSFSEDTILPMHDAPLKTHGSEFPRGLRLGFPICVGYFSASLAFGILARSLGLGIIETIVFSVSNFAGASQFMAVRMISSGAAAPELFVAVLLVNARYFLMGASLARKLDARGLGRKILAAFGTTDESFALGSGQEGRLPFPRFLGIEAIAYSGWVGGTAAGAVAGSFLPASVQAALSGSLYAFFAALLGSSSKKTPLALVGAGSGAAFNCLLVLALGWPQGWAMVVSIVLGTLAAFIAGEWRRKAAAG